MENGYLRMGSAGAVVSAFFIGFMLMPGTISSVGRGPDDVGGGWT